MAMKKLDLFVFRSFIGPLVFTFFIVLIVLILQFLFMYIDELIGKGLEFKIMAELLYHFSLTFVPMALPLSILLASLMTFGNMGEFNELTALKSSGIPLRRIMQPVIIIVSVLSIISFFFSNNVQPYSYGKARTLLYDIRRKRPELNIQAGTFNNDVDGFSIKVTTKNPETNKLEKILIYDHRDRRGNVAVTYADSGYMKITPDESGMILTLFNGYSYYDIEEKDVPPSQQKYPFRRDRFKEQTIVISLSGFDFERSKEDLLKFSSATKNIRQLQYYIDSLSKLNIERKKSYFTEFNTAFIYQKRNFYVPGVTVNDSSELKNAPAFEPWKLLDTMNLDAKKYALDRALEYARYSANYVTEKREQIQNNTKSLRNYQIDYHKKFTLSLACIVFLLIGAPLGSIIRKGGLGTPAVISVFFFVIYYIISVSTEKLARESHINIFIGMWAAFIILLPVGIFLTYKATTDSSIFNIETYTRFFKKIKDKLYKIIFNIKYEDNYNENV
ncbi:MAG TPA: LptF/LptG family permease [Bacteroidales bacterium]|nr:LptF/LptG family permease [Bacteroidales bacterium]